jgi:hypothetical protein
MEKAKKKGKKEYPFDYAQGKLPALRVNSEAYLPSLRLHSG